MGSEAAVNNGKRRFLIGATSVVGGIGVIGAATPFVMSLLPSERAKAAGAPVEVDISKVEPGMKINVAWRGKPRWLLNRTPAMLATLPKMVSRVAEPKSDVPQQPTYCKNETRSIKPEMWIAVGICTHLGCSPTFRPEPRMAGRFLLPLPPVEIRPRRSRVQGRARADESRHSATPVRVRYEGRDRRRSEARVTHRSAR